MGAPTTYWQKLEDEIDRALGIRFSWEWWGSDGIKGVAEGHCSETSVYVTRDDWDGFKWIHASVTRSDRLPSYYELTALQKAVWGAGGYAYQVFADDYHHVNISPNMLHLWGLADGLNVLPDFTTKGPI